MIEHSKKAHPNFMDVLGFGWGVFGTGVVGMILITRFKNFDFSAFDFILLGIGIMALIASLSKERQINTLRVDERFVRVIIRNRPKYLLAITELIDYKLSRNLTLVLNDGDETVIYCADFGMNKKDVQELILYLDRMTIIPKE